MTNSPRIPKHSAGPSSTIRGKLVEDGKVGNRRGDEGMKASVSAPPSLTECLCWLRLEREVRSLELVVLVINGRRAHATDGQ